MNAREGTLFVSYWIACVVLDYWAGSHIFSTFIVEKKEEDQGATGTSAEWKHSLYVTSNES